MNLRTPKVTALIDTYNHEKFIADAIDSVLQQTFSPVDTEILVIDDGSVDATPAIVGKFGGRVRLIRKNNGGQGTAFNTGIAAAKGDLIAFLDGDDWWRNDKLETVVRYMDANPQVGVLGHGYCVVNSVTKNNTNTIPTERHSFGFDSTDDATFFRQMMSFFGTSRLVLRNKVARETLPIPSKIAIEADEFMAIVAIAQAKATLIAEPLTFYRLHDDNLYQFQSNDGAKLVRLRDVLNELALEVPPRLAAAGVSVQIINILTHTLVCGAKRIDLRLGNGTRWEALQLERAERRFYHADESLGYRLFKGLTGALILALPPTRFYQLRAWYGTSRLRQWRKVVGEPIPAARIQYRPDTPLPTRLDT
jgi:exopolysaccharide biosynthesis glycosyltransferase PssF